MGLLFLFIGLTVASQTRTHAEIGSIKQAPSRQLEQMVALLKEAEDKKATLEKEVSSLRKEVEKMQKTENPVISEERLKRIYQLAGLTELDGKGVRVTLDDRSSSKLPTPDNDGLVHGDDILKLVNELKSAGCTAITVNNQRLVTTSEIVDAGGSIMINQTRLVSPYVISALGDPETLKVSLSIRGSILEYLKFYGIDVKVETPE
ncbi:MAG: DUF881 domain-containing protein, partial [Cyanobacteriota bacterium]